MKRNHITAAIALVSLVTTILGPAALAGETAEIPAVPEVTTTLRETVPEPVQEAIAPVAEPAAEGEQEAHAAASSSGSVVDLDVMGEDALTVSESSSSAGQSQSGGSSSGGSSSKATLLSVLGQELWGAEANSEEGANEREGLLLEVTDQICSGTGGQLCVSLLYEERTSSKDDGNSEKKSVASVCAGGEQEQASHDCDGPVSLTVGYAGASAHEDENGSESSSDTAVLDACVGSEGHSASDTCDGPIGGRVAESHSDSASETDSPEEGDQSAESGAENSAAEVCAGGENAKTGMCDGVGAVVLHSESYSSANTQGGSKSEGLAQTVALEAEGEEQFSITEETEISVPPDCPEQSIVCLFLNTVESEAEAGKAGGSATAVVIEVGDGILGDTPIVGGTVDDSDSQVDLGSDTPDDVKDVFIEKPDRDGPAGANPPLVAAAPRPQVAPLPFTGSGTRGWIILALVLMGAGIMLKRRSDTALEH